MATVPACSRFQALNSTRPRPRNARAVAHVAHQRVSCTAISQEDLGAKKTSVDDNDGSFRVRQCTELLPSWPGLLLNWEWQPSCDQLRAALHAGCTGCREPYGGSHAATGDCWRCCIDGALLRAWPRVPADSRHRARCPPQTLPELSTCSLSRLCKPLWPECNLRRAGLQVQSHCGL